MLLWRLCFFGVYHAASGVRAEVRPLRYPMGMSRHHRIDYIEFTVASVPEAKEFYGSIFGWEFNDYGPGYAGIRGAEGEVGGFAEGTATPGGALVVLFSDQLEGTLERVREAGGNIVKEIFEFPGGRRFHFADPFGNELAVWGAPIAD